MSARLRWKSVMQRMRCVGLRCDRGALRGPVTRVALVLAGLLPLSGCLTAVFVVAASMRPSPQSEFEAHADGRLYAPYVDACYWRRQLDPAHSLCGRPIESREIPEGVEHVHGLDGECVYSFVVDSKTQLITSWRYLSEPQNCWTPPKSG